MSDSNSDQIPDNVSTAGQSNNWTYDPLGNWVDGAGAGRMHNLQNQITSLVCMIPSGTGTKEIPDYDANGNPNCDENNKRLRYDAWNRLVTVKSGSTLLLTYAYDALGRRVSRTDETATTSAPVRLYYSTDWQVLQEGPDFGVTAQYVWSPVYVDALVLRDRNMDGNGSAIDGTDERLYVQQDANWNVTAVVGPSGVQERYVYDPYGQVTVYDATLNGPSPYALNWVYYHQGGRFDSTTGLYNFRIREYSPTLGRWISSDPMGFGAGDPNFYRFVGNNPGNYVDPSGLRFEVTVTLDKRAHNPYLVASRLPDRPTLMPWCGDKLLQIRFA